MKGPGDFEPDDEDDRIEQRVEELVEDWQKEPSKLMEASERVYEGGMLDLTEVIDALASLNGMDTEKMVGSDAFARVLRAAANCERERDTELKEIAEEQAQKESEGWPAWKGTASLTRHHAQLQYARAQAQGIDL